MFWINSCVCILTCILGAILVPETQGVFLFQTLLICIIIYVPTSTYLYLLLYFFHVSSGKTLTELTTMYEKKEKFGSNSNQSTYARQFLSKEEEAKNTIRDI